MANKTIIMLILFLLPLAAVQQDEDGQTLLSRFMRVLSGGISVRRRRCPANNCEEVGECSSNCNHCEKLLASHHYKKCQRR
uniref:Ubs_03 putative toxin n=1 Tax=Unedogemmula bisaya TaxID=746885 RepID=A0A098LY08_UNEBI